MSDHNDCAHRTDGHSPACDNRHANADARAILSRAHATLTRLRKAVDADQFRTATNARLALSRHIEDVAAIVGADPAIATCVTALAARADRLLMGAPEEV